MTTAQQIWLGVGIIVFLIIISSLLLVFIYKKRSIKPKIDEDFINSLLEALGSKSNIKEVSNINGRLLVLLEDLELANLEELKKLSSGGVFITNNTVKMLFTYDTNSICQSLKSN